MRKLLMIAGVAVLLSVGSGCIIVTDPDGSPRHRQYSERRVVVEDDYGPEPVGTIVTYTDCHHHEGCGHYWHNGNWYFAAGHVHRPGCGHFYQYGRWVNVGTVTVHSGHVCTASCHHYYHDGGWYVGRGHVHGPGCGHVQRGGVWIAVRW